MKVVLCAPRAVSPAGVMPRLHPPTGLLFTAGQIRAEGHTVAVLDSAVLPLVGVGVGEHQLPIETQRLGEDDYWKVGARPDQVALQLAANPPDVVGIACATVADRGEARCLAQAVRSVLPDVPIILGGHEAGFWAEEILASDAARPEAIPAVDYVVVGASQPSIGELLTNIGRGELHRPVAGVADREHPSSWTQMPQPFDPNSCALPAYDLLPSVWTAHGFAKDLYSALSHPHAGDLAALGVAAAGSYFPLHTSFGCGFNCSFCDTPRALVRYSASNVGRMINAFSSIFPVAYIDILDNNFGGGGRESRAIAFEILDLLAELGTPIGFSNGLTFESMSRDKFALLDRFAQMETVRHIAFPCENGNDRVLSMIHKPHNLALVMRVLHRARELLPDTNREGFFIGGFPETSGKPAESPDEVAQTVEFVRRLLSEDLLDQAIFLTMSPVTKDYRSAWRKLAPTAPFEACLFSEATSVWPYPRRYLDEAREAVKRANDDHGSPVTRRFTYKDFREANVLPVVLG